MKTKMTKTVSTCLTFQWNEGKGLFHAEAKSDGIDWKCSEDPASLLLYKYMLSRRVFSNLEYTLFQVRENREQVDWCHYRFEIHGAGSPTVPNFILKRSREGTQSNEGVLEKLFSEDWPEVAKRLGKSLAFRVWHVLELDSYKESRQSRIGQLCELNYTHTIEVAAYAEGICYCAFPLRISGDNRKPGTACDEVVLTEAAGHNMQSLAAIWHDPSARFVLVSGPPGSGKEKLSQNVHYGRGRPGEIKSLSLGGIRQVELERLLYGGKSERGDLIPGYLETAERGSLFIDEVDKASEDNGMRAGLLRTMEAGEFLVPETTSIRSWDDVLWIFGAGMTLPELRTLRPPDFWTRMTNILEVWHPVADSPPYDSVEDPRPSREEADRRRRRALEDILYNWYAQEIVKALVSSDARDEARKLFDNLIRTDTDAAPFAPSGFQRRLFEQLVWPCDKGEAGRRSDFASEVVGFTAASVVACLDKLARSSPAGRTGIAPNNPIQERYCLYRRLSVRCVRNLGRTLAGIVLENYARLSEVLENPVATIAHWTKAANGLPPDGVRLKVTCVPASDARLDISSLEAEKKLALKPFNDVADRIVDAVWDLISLTWTPLDNAEVAHVLGFGVRPVGL